MTVTLDPKTILSGNIKIISSKSDIHRCIICASLCKEPTEIEFCGLSKDILSTVDCVKTLGANVSFCDGKMTVTGCDSSKIRQGNVFDCGESGSTARFMLPVVSVLCKGASLIGNGRLPERPFEPLCDALSLHGAQFTSTKIPMTITSNVKEGGVFELPGNISSQYISGILLSLPLIKEGGQVVVTTNLESKGYVDMTVETMRRFGIDVDVTDNVYTVKGGQKYVSPGKITAQGDWSSAAFWLCADALGANVCVSGLDITSSQKDKYVLDILERFGAKKIVSNNGIRVEAGRLRGIDIQANDIPDLVPVLSVVAAGAKGITRISGASRLKLKESDRLETTRKMLSDLGADIIKTDDGLVINGTGKLNGGTVDGQNDHRIVMSAAVASLICKEPVIINGAQAAEKSYTTFFSDFDSLIMKG